MPRPRPLGGIASIMAWNYAALKNNPPNTHVDGKEETWERKGGRESTVVVGEVLRVYSQLQTSCICIQAKLVQAGNADNSSAQGHILYAIKSK